MHLIEKTEQNERWNVIRVEWWDGVIGVWVDMGEHRSHSDARRLIGEALEQDPELRIRLVEQSFVGIEYGVA